MCQNIYNIDSLLGIVGNYIKGLQKIFLMTDTACILLLNKAVLMSNSIMWSTLKFSWFNVSLFFCSFIHSKIFAHPQTKKEPHLRVSDLKTLPTFIVYMQEFNLCLILKL